MVEKEKISGLYSASSPRFYTRYRLQDFTHGTRYTLQVKVLGIGLTYDRSVVCSAAYACVIRQDGAEMCAEGEY
jgi:hypothetical protein